MPKTLDMRNGINKVWLILLIILSLLLIPKEIFANETVSQGEEDITIGVTYCKDRSPYIKAIEEIGAVPYLFPLVTTKEDAQNELAKVDGFIISGGSAVDPSYYGEQLSNKVQEVAPERDMSDMLMLNHAIELDMPVIGICRGMQLMNVAQGGSLYQDIDAEYKKTGSKVIHRDPNKKKWMIHTVEIEKDTTLHDIMRRTELDGMSWHHQGVKKLGKDLTVMGRTKDGIIEAIEFDNQTFMIGVQFHPEKAVIKRNGEQIEIFKTLAEQATAFREKKLTSLAAPDLATAVLYEYSKVKVYWNNVDYASGYSVYHKKSNSKTYTLLKRTTETNVKTGELNAGTKYDFKVIPYIKRGKSFYEADDFIETSIYTLKKVGTPYLEKNSDGTVILNWEGIKGQSGYQISCSTSSSETNIVSTWKTITGTSKEIKAENITDGKYFYKVRAYRQIGDQKIYGPWSDTVSNRRGLDVPKFLTAKVYVPHDIEISLDKVGNTPYYAICWKRGNEKMHMLYVRTLKYHIRKLMYTF